MVGTGRAKGQVRGHSNHKLTGTDDVGGPRGQQEAEKTSNSRCMQKAEPAKDADE
jgi:hypothetical protein